MESSVHNQNIDISKMFSMGLPVVAEHYFEVHTVEQLKDALLFCKDKNCKPIILGGGSNVLPAPNLDCVIKVTIKGIDWNSLPATFTHDDKAIFVTVGAGEIWDDFVKQSCEHGFYDLAALSAIPGTVGATPVQNVGAYGTEICNHMTSLEVLEIETGETKTITNKECEFAYRTSKFKTDWAGKYIVTSVTFKLNQKEIIIPNYPGVSEELQKLGTHISPLIIRQAITNIRWRKLPKPSELPNCGSFFHNPIITKVLYNELKNKFEHIPGHNVENDMVKVPAGWLVEYVGYKGKRVGNFGTSSDNALVVVHYGNGTRDELLQFADEIINAVLTTFTITINREPLLLD